MILHGKYETGKINFLYLPILMIKIYPDHNMVTYIRGLVVASVTSAVGLWMIYRAAKKDTNFMNGTLKIPRWLVFCVGILMQLLLVIYAYLGIKGGFSVN